jgi:hypothetical protein
MRGSKENKDNWARLFKADLSLSEGTFCRAFVAFNSSCCAFFYPRKWAKAQGNKSTGSLEHTATLLGHFRASVDSVIVLTSMRLVSFRPYSLLSAET